MLDIREALTGTLRRMHYVQRYSSIPTVKPENVAEHSWQVAMLGYLMAVDTNMRHKEVSVDTGQVVLKAIVHDVTEAMSGDIIRSFKHGSQAMKNACEEQDFNNIVLLEERLGIRDLVTRFCNAKSEDLEGTIVALADMLTVVSYCVSEHRLGNRQADFVLQELYEKELVRWHNHPKLGWYVTTIFPTGNYTDAYKD